MPQRRLQQQHPLCTGRIVGWCYSSTITIPAVWWIDPVENIWTKLRCYLTFGSAFAMTKRQFKHTGMSPGVDLKWLSGIIPIQISTVSFLGGRCSLHLVDPAKWTIWTACSLHWKYVTGIATALHWEYFALLIWLKYWSWSMLSIKSAHLLKHPAIWFCSSPFGITNRSAKSSRVMIAGTRFYIVRWIGAWIRGISLLRWCLPEIACSSQYWDTSFLAFVRKFWKAASSRFDCWYACLRCIIALAGCWDLAFIRLPSLWIWPEKWFRKCIFTKLKYDSLTRCCAASGVICILSSAMWWYFAAAERLFQPGSLTGSSSLSKVSSFLQASETFLVNSLAPNWLKITLWQSNSSRFFSMYSIMALVWYRHWAIRCKCTEFLMHTRASVKGILWLTEGFERLAMKTGTTTSPSASITLWLHCITWPGGLSQWAKPGYGGIIAQSRLYCSTLECWLSMDITQFIKCFHRLR